MQAGFTIEKANNEIPEQFENSLNNTESILDKKPLDVTASFKARGHRSKSLTAEE